MTGEIELATSRYSNHRLIIESGLIPVRITLGFPRFKLAYTLGGKVMKLAPTRSIFGIEDPETFRLAYRSQLDGHGVEVIAADLAEISVLHAGCGLVLLCFEDLTDKKRYGVAPEEHVCHRRGFAAWWRERTGQHVRELGR